MALLCFPHSDAILSLGWDSVELGLQAWDTSWLEFANPASSRCLSFLLTFHMDSDVPLCGLLCCLGVRCTDLKSKNFSHNFRSFPLHLGIGVQMWLYALSLGWVLESVLLLGIGSQDCARSSAHRPSLSDTTLPHAVRWSRLVYSHFIGCLNGTMVCAYHLPRSLKRMCIVSAVYMYVVFSWRKCKFLWK